MCLTSADVKVFSFATFDRCVLVFEDFEHQLLSLSWPKGPKHSRPVFRLRVAFCPDYTEGFAGGRIAECEFVRWLAPKE